MVSKKISVAPKSGWDNIMEDTKKNPIGIIVFMIIAFVGIIILLNNSGIDMLLVVSTLIFCIVFGIIGYYIGKTKGRSSEGFLRGFLLGFIGVLIILFLPNKGDSQSIEIFVKHCPYCSEKIQETAKKCKHCGEWLTKKSINKKN